MGYHAPDAIDVYDYVFRRGRHAPRHLTDGFGWSILFVNDGSQQCKDFLAHYGQKLCYLTADRVRFVFFSGLTDHETQELADRANANPRRGFLSQISSAVKNPFGRRYDQERDVWQELRPEPLFPLDSRERIHRHLDMECEILGAMPGAEEAHRFAQRAGIGRFVPCFLLFSDVRRAPACVWPVGGQSPERVFNRLRGWIDAFYERNKKVLNDWAEIEKEVEETIVSLKTTASGVEWWREERAAAWKCLQRVSLYQRRLERTDVSNSLLKEICEDAALNWDIRHLADSYYEQLKAVERRIADAHSTVEHTERLLTIESIEKVREELKGLMVRSVGAIPPAVRERIAIAERSCQPLSPPLPLPEQLREWWKHVRQLPRRRHDALRYCWKPYSEAKYRVDVNVNLGEIVNAEYSLAISAACAITVTCLPEEAAASVLAQLATHLEAKQDAAWTATTEEYRQFLTTYFSHLKASAPPWMLENGPKLMTDFCWGDCIPSAQMIQEVSRRKCLERMPRLVSLLDQVQGESQAHAERQAMQWRDNVKASLKEVFSSASQWLAGGDWIASDRASIVQALHDELARERQELEKTVIEAANKKNLSTFPGPVLSERKARRLMQLLDDYRGACDALEFPYERDAEVLRISLELDRQHESRSDERHTPLPPDAAAKSELIDTTKKANEALAEWPRIEIESLSWSPSGKLFEALRQSLDEGRLETLYLSSTGSTWQKLSGTKVGSDDIWRAVASNAKREDIIRLLDQLDVEELFAIERYLRKADEGFCTSDSVANTKSALHEFILSAIGLAPPLTKKSREEELKKHDLIPASGFDVFLAHNSTDRREVFELGQMLRSRGIYPWIDVEQVPPGRWFQDVLQSAVRSVKSAAVLIGQSGLGRWQMAELRTFISQCVERSIPVIPVLLPGVAEIPDELPFLRQLHSVRFQHSIEEEDAVAAIIWGITGKRHIP